MTQNTAMTGGCQCGAVRYSVEGAKIAYCCHCTECQKQSSSAFGISVPVFESGLKIEGPLGCWTRPTDSGSYTDCHFCERCGTRLYHSGHSRSGIVTIKGGSLDNPQTVPIIAHIWTQSRRMDLPLDDSVPHWPKQPTTDADWLELMQGQVS